MNNPAAKNNLRYGGVLMKKNTIFIEGMSCGHCVMAVEKALGKLPGVSRVVVSLDAHTADVEYNDAEVSLDEMYNAIENQGYAVRR